MSRHDRNTSLHEAEVFCLENNCIIRHRIYERLYLAVYGARNENFVLVVRAINGGVSPELPVLSSPASHTASLGPRTMWSSVAVNRHRDDPLRVVAIFSKRSEVCKSH